VADKRFCDSIKAKRRLAEQILQATNGAAQKQSGRRVTAAQTKIKRNEQRQVQNCNSRELKPEKSLKEKSEQHGKENCSAPEFVNFNVSFAAAQVKGIVHRGFSCVLVEVSCACLPVVDF